MGTQNEVTVETVEELHARLSRAHFGETVDLTHAYTDDGEGGGEGVYTFPEVISHPRRECYVYENPAYTEPAVIFGRFAVIDGSIRRLDDRYGYCDVAPGTDEVCGDDFAAAQEWCRKNVAR